MTCRILTFINEPFSSNTYLIINKLNNRVIIIDPGDTAPEDLLNFIKMNKMVVSHVILTHEHYDHICGINYLYSFFKFQLVASNLTIKNLQNPKITLSKYLNKGFLLPNQELFLNILKIDSDVFNVNLSGLNFDFILTPGHSEGGMCIKCENKLFTGDTVLNNIEIYTKFPGGDKNRLNESIKKINEILNKSILIYPGHGEPFKLLALF